VTDGGPYRAPTTPAAPPLPRRGRPPLAGDVRRGHASTVLFTADEWAAIRAGAAAAGLPPAVYVRRLAVWGARNLRGVP
jgi:hypothetical protein